MIKIFYKKYPVIFTILFEYIIFILLFPVSKLLRPIEKFVFEFDDILLFSVYIWPYPLLLSFQKWFTINIFSFVFANIIGASLVFLLGLFLQKTKFFTKIKTKLVMGLLLLPLWILLLIAIEIIIFLIIGVILGIPIGE